MLRSFEPINAIHQHLYGLHCYAVGELSYFIRHIRLPEALSLTPSISLRRPDPRCALAPLLQLRPD